MPIFNFSYKKVGGLHFIRLGRFGCSFFLSRRAVNLRSEERRYPDGSYMLVPLTRRGEA